jgi:membrane associated rhomboid family serine protease
VQASVGSHCLDCVRAARPPTAERLRRWNAAQGAIATKVLIAVNVGVFVWTQLLGGGALLSDRINSHQDDIALSRLQLAQGDTWRLLTSGFLHFGALHIAFNMLLLYQLGQMLEPALGRVRFLLLYFAALFAGSAGGILLVDSPAVRMGGASGAVFGLMGAAAVGLHRRGVNIFQTGLGTVLVLNLVLTFTISGISIGGHLGGLVGGLLCGAIMLDPRLTRSERILGAVMPVVVMAASVALALVWVRDLR